MSWIVTATGRQFDLLNPTPEMVSAKDIAAALSKLCRFTGHVSRFYSVAEHSLMGANWIGEEYFLEFLLHDAAEAYVGDMNLPLKRMNHFYRSIEKRVDAAIRECFGLPLECSPEVKRMDLVMLATEKRDLMPETDEPWPVLDGVEPLKVSLASMSQSCACLEQEMLKAIREYWVAPTT